MFGNKLNIEILRYNETFTIEIFQVYDNKLHASIHLVREDVLHLL